ncbi:MAG: nodulation protein NfeD [Dehalococcoidia bacterium]|nr:nodulation protein NfeD [Dehalococcoidia bacterium]
MADRSHHDYARTARVLLATLAVLIGLWGLVSDFGRDPTVAAQGIDAEADSKVVLIRLDGAIDFVTARFIRRGLDMAAEKDSELVVLMLNTPGGLLDATRDIVEAMLVSEVPVAVYVAPEGAQAASAGTFIGAAANILAMAPTTNIGAASVVSSDGNDLPDTLSRKATQDAAAFIRSIAETRGRNVSALDDTVLFAAAYSATEAVELNVADIVAADYASLLVQLDGYEVEVDGDPVVLDLGKVDTLTIDLTLLERLLAFISSPNIAFLLVSLGGLGVIVELWNPGMWVPGTLGVLFLILGWAGIGQLPFSWAGVSLIALSLLLFYLESTAPGIGYFGVAGTVCLLLGGLFLVGFFGSPSIPGDDPTVNRWLLTVVGVSIGAFVLWFASELRKAARIRLYRSPVVSVSLVGATGVVSATLSPSGEVHVNGEYWSGGLEPDGVESLAAGENVEVVGVEGNHLTVRPFGSDTEIEEASDESTSDN